MAVTKKYTTIVGDFVAGAQAQSQTPLDFATGSIFRALAEATAGVADWLQRLWLFALSVTRLATSQGTWVDSFCADYMPVVPGTTSPRLPAVAATGLVTFSRFTPGSQAVVPVGAALATGDGSQAFTVYADPTLAAYSGTAGPGGTPAYVIPAGVPAMSLPVQAAVAGAAGNVTAGAISSLRSAVSGVDRVTNPAPFTTGLDAETDDALKARFPLYVASLSKATDGAIGYAVVSTRQGLQYSIVDAPGLVTVTVDDGSGAISADLVAACQTAVNAVRAGGVQVAVLPAAKVSASVQMSLGYAAGYFTPTVAGQVSAAVAAYIDGLGIGTTLRYTALEHVAYGVPGVTNVTGVLLNGTTADILGTPSTTIKAGNVSVS